MGFWSNFWDLIGWFLTFFVFAAYLFALFAIVADLFRDRKLNGWYKAIWIVALIFVPFLTALVYVIARGKGMAERQTREVQEVRTQTEDYIRSVGGTGVVEEIARAKALLDEGAITTGEFEAIKAHVIAKTSSEPLAEERGSATATGL